MIVKLNRSIFHIGIRPYKTRKNLVFITLLIKNNYSSSTYLDLTRRNPLSETLVKLRISCHKFSIETGRYKNIPRNEILCKFCN